MLRTVIISKANFTTNFVPGFQTLRKFWGAPLTISETVEIRIFRWSKDNPQNLLHFSMLHYVPVKVPNCMQVVKRILSLVSKLL